MSGIPGLMVRLGRKAKDTKDPCKENRFVDVTRMNFDAWTLSQTVGEPPVGQLFRCYTFSG